MEQPGGRRAASLSRVTIKGQVIRVVSVSAGGPSPSCQEGRFARFLTAWNEEGDTVDPLGTEGSAADPLGLLLQENRSQEGTSYGGQVGPACKMLG